MAEEQQLKENEEKFRALEALAGNKSKTAANIQEQ